MKALEDYSWPGNVRQLRHVIEKMVVLSVGDRLTVEDLPLEITEAAAPERVLPRAPARPAPVAGGGDPSETLKDVEKRRIFAALEECAGNKSKAAERLGISRRTLHRKLNVWREK
jgi:DNA-binding NtrC family response regulator